MATSKQRHPPTRKYRVYVIRLRASAWDGSAKLRKANPDYVPGKPVVYVGSTALSADTRFAKHKAGGSLSSPLVKKFGKHVMESETARHRPRSTRNRAERLEREVAEGYRRRGWAVWFNAEP